MSRGYTDYRNDNPYAQQDRGYGASQQGYGYGQQSTYGGQQGGSNYEMGPVGNGGGPVTQENYLDEVQNIRQDIAEVKQLIDRIQERYDRLIREPNESQAAQLRNVIDGMTAQISQKNSALVARIRGLKQVVGPQNNQAMNVDRAFQQELQRYRQIELSSQKAMQDQMVRQYKVVRPELSDEEAREAIENSGGGAIFSQALMQSDRRGQASSVLDSVVARQNEIQKIERTLVELAELFTQLNEQVVQQEAKVEVIDTQADEARVNVEAGQEQMVEATNKARAARRKKWWCLLIVVIIIVVIGVILAIVFTRNNGGGSKRRSLEYLTTGSTGASLDAPLKLVRKSSPLDMPVRRSSFMA